jgi:hypothetical protein
MEDILWIEDIVVAPPFCIKSRIDMVGFVDSPKVITIRRVHF